MTLRCSLTLFLALSRMVQLTLIASVGRNRSSADPPDSYAMSPLLDLAPRRTPRDRILFPPLIYQNVSLVPQGPTSQTC